jgi:hypothetical protein
MATVNEQLTELRYNQDAQSTLLNAIADATRANTDRLSEVIDLLSQPAGTELADALREFAANIATQNDILIRLPQQIADEVVAAI